MATEGLAVRGALPRLQAVTPHLVRQVRGVGDFILTHPDQILRSSLAEVAASAGVSQATVVRCCQRAGFRGFRQFQMALAYDFAERPVTDLGDAVSVHDDLATVARRLAQASMQMLQDTQKILDFELLEAVATLIAARSSLGILAQGTSRTVAEDFRYNVSKLGIGAQCLSDPFLQLAHVAALGPGDVILAISYAGNNRDLVQALEIAEARRAVSISITSRGASPVALASQHRLVVAQQEIVFQGEPFASQQSFLLATDLLFLAVTRRISGRRRVSWDQVHRALYRKRYGED